MSSTIWTPPAVASESGPARFGLWRAVEAQHIVATMALVDNLDEQHRLERLLDESKASVPDSAADLHWLLFTPFRYRPPPGGSRFRGPTDPGVFYGADEIRTACAELGYWRWRHLLDTPALAAIPTRAQTVFRASVAARTIDLREKPFVRDRVRWTHRTDYTACQALARVARSAGVSSIRYESVRDPERGGCAAVLDPTAFAKPAPLERQTWLLSVSRTNIVWQRTDGLKSATFEFPAVTWQ